jgi:hypothetical protein
MTKRLRRIRSRRDGEAGTAVVELALVLPLFFLLLFGMLDFGKAFNYWIDETHLANLGARWSVVNKNPGAPALTLQQHIRAQANTEEMRLGGTATLQNPISVCISFPNSGSSLVGDPVRVTVAMTYRWLPFLGERISILQTTVRASATMRIEQKPTNYSTSNNLGTC